eukprot:537975_1
MSTIKVEYNKITGQQIDAILDEIEHHEQKSQLIDTDDNVNWEEILTQIRSGNVHYIKNLVTSNDISINSRNPSNGRTLLIYAVIMSNIDLVKAICNFGADPHIADDNNLDALQYARRYGQYRITELLYYQQLSSALGKDMKDIASSIFQKIKEANRFGKQLRESL